MNLHDFNCVKVGLMLKYLQSEGIVLKGKNIAKAASCHLAKVKCDAYIEVPIRMWIEMFTAPQAISY